MHLSIFVVPQALFDFFLKSVVYDSLILPLHKRMNKILLHNHISITDMVGIERYARWLLRCYNLIGRTITLFSGTEKQH